MTSNIEIEYMLDNGKAVDLILREENKVTFFEIAITRPLEKEISNIIKDFSSSLIPDQLIIAVIDGKMKKQLEQLILNDGRIKDYRDKIKIKLAGNIIAQK